MNGAKFLLDTNIVLYILSGDRTIANYLNEQNLFLSVISEIELLGFKNLTAKEEKHIKNFVAELRTIFLDEAIKNEAVALRKNYGLKLPDCIIAATSISLNLTLISADKQFKQIKHLPLEIYQP